MSEPKITPTITLESLEQNYIDFGKDLQNKSQVSSDIKIKYEQIGDRLKHLSDGLDTLHNLQSETDQSLTQNFQPQIQMLYEALQKLKSAVNES